MHRRLIRNRELLAHRRDDLRQEPGAIWWDQDVEIPANEQIGSVCLVHVRGSLEQNHCAHGDSYEDIRARVYEAMCNDESTTVVLCLNTPGGVVAGLNETVRALRKMAEEHGKPLIAYVDGLCASAGYALSCACSEFYLTASAITGSVGVISMIVSQTRADQKAGIDVVTIKSGDRKDDGHVHVPISAEAVKVEQERVDKLALQFFKIVSRARGLSVATIRGLEAGIFLGKDAVKLGLADGVMGLDRLLTQLSGDTKSTPDTKKVLAPLAQAESTSTAQGGAKRPGARMTIHALLWHTKAALAKATDQKERMKLQTSVSTLEAAIEAAKRVKKVVKYEMESTDDDPPDAAEEESEESEESEEAEESEESEESEEAEEKGNETDRKEGDDDDSDDDGGDDDDDEDEAEEAEERGAKKAKMKGKAKMAASVSRAEFEALKFEMGALTKDAQKKNKAALINDARAARRITPGEAKQLAAKPISVVKAVLGMRKKPLVHVDEESALAPTTKRHADLTALEEKETERALASSGLEGEALEKLRAELVEGHRKARMNGAGARY